MNFDPDHALAIILQAKFNEEAKKNRQKDKENLPVPIALNKPPTKSSLVDPDWELTDPCPDVHGLFLAFNDRFFWGRLQTVEVRWSPQMTSCAGICVYEGRNGLCSVRLSAPLLKLRPRSDLVETLLHEMIHAYLFVTHNNRDRDGHGPEFHKHMNRINKEAGTNITVYHSFHAEVKKYQQHWWRCNGPCQRRPPFFGMVKRARNRAPGPNDLWWADHQAACGGLFVKVREPEGYGEKTKGKQKKETKSKDGKDIRNFFKNPTGVNGNNTLFAKPSTNGKVGSNVFGFKNLPSSNTSGANVNPFMRGDVNRVVGFGDLSSSGTSSPKTPPKMFGGGYVLGRGTGECSKGKGEPSKSSGGVSGTSKPSAGRGGMLANRGGGTLVVTGSKAKIKTEDKSPSPKTKLRIDNFKLFSGSGFTLGGTSGTIDRSRSRLLSLGNEPDKKKQKIDEERKYNRSSFDCSGGDMIKCSVCNESMPREDVDVHLESCEGLRNVFNNSTVVDNADCDDKEISEINNKCKITWCPVCALNIEGDINAHVNECLNTSGILNMFEEPPIEISDTESPVFNSKNVPKLKEDSDSDVEIIESENRVACMICGMRFGESRINAHVNECLDAEDEEITL